MVSRDSDVALSFNHSGKFPAITVPHDSFAGSFVVVFRASLANQNNGDVRAAIILCFSQQSCPRHDCQIISISNPTNNIFYVQNPDSSHSSSKQSPWGVFRFVALRSCSKKHEYRSSEYQASSTMPEKYVTFSMWIFLHCGQMQTKTAQKTTQLRT